MTQGTGKSGGQCLKGCTFILLHTWLTNALTNQLMRLNVSTYHRSVILFIATVAMLLHMTAHGTDFKTPCSPTLRHWVLTPPYYLNNLCHTIQT